MSFSLAGKDVVLDRAKEILRLKLKVRRLEAQCLRIYGGHAEPRPNADDSSDDVGKEKTERGLQTADGCERQANGEEGPPGEPPLVILRNDRSSDAPSILRQLRANQLSDSMATFTPSDFQEAKEAHHQLKVQFLNLQAVMLSWAITNKRLRNTHQKRAKEEGKGEVSILAPRLRELLRLEAAVKAMFTETQLKAIVRNHKDASRDVLAEKRKQLQWDEEDLCRMLELRAISSDKVVNHVREKMKIPLPTMKTAKLRCAKSLKLSIAYKEMLQAQEKKQMLCGMCERQVNTIDGVIDAKDSSGGWGGESPFGRQFMQRVSHRGQDTVGSKPKKRRRTTPTTTSTTSPTKKKKKKRRHAALDWPDTSDSDAELSDPGVWGRFPPSRVSWHPEVIGGGAPPGRRPPPLGSTTDPFGYG